MPLHGACFCRLTSFSITEDRAQLTLSAICHCSRCTTYNGGLAVWTTHWKRDAVAWDGDADRQPERYEMVQGTKFRLRCKSCGSTVGSWNEAKQEWSIWPVTLQRNSEGRLDYPDWLSPTDHQFYGTHIIDMPDSLPKWEGYAGRSKRLE